MEADVACGQWRWQELFIDCIFAPISVKFLPQKIRKSKIRFNDSNGDLKNFFLSGHEQVQTFSQFSYIRRLHLGVLPIDTLLKGSKSRCWVNFRQKSEVLSTLLSTDQMFYDNYFEFIRVLSNMENISLIQNGRFKKVLFGLGRKTSQDSEFSQVKPD